MTKSTLLFFLLFSCLAGMGQNKLIPPSYELLQDVKGDLDKDGIEEWAAVYNTKSLRSENYSEGVDRELIIFKKKGNERGDLATIKPGGIQKQRRRHDGRPIRDSGYQ